jgi:hypothetical protein
MTIREVNTFVGGQHALGGEIPLRFQGLPTVWSDLAWPLRQERRAAKAWQEHPLCWLGTSGHEAGRHHYHQPMEMNPRSLAGWMLIRRYPGSARLNTDAG